MVEATQQNAEREPAARDAGDIVDAIGDVVEDTVSSVGRVTKALVNGVADVTVSSIDAFTDVIGRSRGAARERSERQRSEGGERRTSAGRMAQDWADFITDTTEIVSDTMTRSARSVQRATDRFAKDSEKPAGAEGEREGATPRSPKKS